MKKLMMGFALLGLFLSSTACKPNKIMVHEQFIYGTNKLMRESMRPTGTVGDKSSRQTLSNYYIQICDADGNEAKNCHTSLVLENIMNYQVHK